MSANFDDLFNLPLDDFKEEKKEVKNFERYNPQTKDGEGNVYTAVVRFLPWFKDPNNNERGKRVCWLENLATGDKRYVDCGKEIGQKDVITDLFFKLKKSESAKDQELSKMFKTTQKYASLIQVVKDKQHPELEGKIMVWQYGITIHDKIEEMKSTCKCGNKASINARIDKNGNIVTAGKQIEIGSEDKYVTLCRKCYYKMINKKK